MCVKPKKIDITSESGDIHTVYVPCGKCLECQNQSRAEWVLRCIYELKINKYPFFLTLTYDDDHLPADYLDESDRKSIFQSIDLGIIKNYGDFLVDKEHLSTFLIGLNKSFQQCFHSYELNRNNDYRKKLAVARKFKNDVSAMEIKTFLRSHIVPRLRYLATAEYGCLNKRPHYHILLFSPDKLSKQDLENICKPNWIYGNVDVQIPNTETAVFNYVCKHQIKEDFGTPFQNQAAPIFKKSSTYLGGIGFNLRFDRDIQSKFDNRDNGVSQTIELPYDDTLNVFPFPRYVRKFLHPAKLSLLELNKLQSDSLDRIIKDITAAVGSFDINELEKYIKKVFHDNSVKDFNDKKLYFKNKYINKLIKNRNHGR